MATLTPEDEQKEREAAEATSLRYAGARGVMARPCGCVYVEPFGDSAYFDAYCGGTKGKHRCDSPFPPWRGAQENPGPPLTPEGWAARQKMRQNEICSKCWSPAGNDDKDVDAHAKQCGFDPRLVPLYGLTVPVGNLEKA